MKKKIICLFLGVTMVISMVLTSCEKLGGNSTEETTSTSNRAMTLTIATSKGENTSDAAIERVTKAINVITEAKYNTHVEFYFYPKDELKKAVLSKVDDIQNQLKGGAGLASDNVDEEAEDEVIVDEESGRKTTVYPSVDPTQFDIILINGIDDYTEYMNMNVFVEGEEEKGLLAEITPTTLVSQYVDPVVLTMAKDYSVDSVDFASGTAYAIPNNRDWGEYNYIVVNKELADKYYYDPDKFCSYDDGSNNAVISLGAVEKLFTEVRDDYGTEYTLLANKPGIDTITYTIDEGIPLGTSQFMLPGSSTTTRLEAPPKNLYGSDAYKTYYRVMSQLNSWGCMPTNEVADLNSKFVVAYVKGCSESVANIDRNKYYVGVANTPVKSNDTVFGSMYAVTKYTKSVERATEIIEMFNCNADFRNTLYYGVENIDYVKDADSGNIIRTTKDWNMDIYDSGNLFLLERSEELGDYYYSMSKNNWESGKALNRDSVTGLNLGFCVEKTDAIQSNIDSLRKKVAAWDAQLLVSGDAAAVSSVKDQFDASPEYEYLCGQTEGVNTLLKQYRSWYGKIIPAK